MTGAGEEYGAGARGAKIGCERLVEAIGRGDPIRIGERGIPVDFFVEEVGESTFFGDEDRPGEVIKFSLSVGRADGNKRVARGSFFAAA